MAAQTMLAGSFIYKLGKERIFFDVNDFKVNLGQSFNHYFYINGFEEVI
jgi:hypothetical protein